MMTWEGQRVTVSPHAVKFVSRVVRRSWRERWLSRPWRPWKATRVETVAEPAALSTPNGLVVHPAVWRAMREAERG